MPVDWRTGEIGTSDVLSDGYPSVDGGRTVGREGAKATVIDVATVES